MNKSPARSYDNDDGINRWRNARKKCYEKGADLMMVRDVTDLNGLLSMYYMAGGFYRRPLFLGSREYFNTRWKWLDGGEVNPDLWGHGEPNIREGRCGVIENFEKRWINKGCGWWLAARVCQRARRAYICETSSGQFYVILVNCSLECITASFNISMVN